MKRRTRQTLERVRVIQSRATVASMKGDKKTAEHLNQKVLVIVTELEGQGLGEEAAKARRIGELEAAQIFESEK